MSLELDIKKEAEKLIIKPLNESVEWLQNRKNFLERLKTDNLQNFMNWKECLDLFVVRNNPAIRTEFDSLDLGYWKDILKESSTGTSVKASYASYSENLIHYAYHVSVFQNKYGKHLKDLSTIVEFGGGYGGLCKVIKDSGFKGKYVIYDLPELNLLQKYFLTKEGCMDNVILTSDYSVFDKNYDLLIATWSLSETPLEMRDKVINSAKNYLMAFQNSFSGIDNVSYFSKLGIDVFPIEHLLPNYYAMRYFG